MRRLSPHWAWFIVLSSVFCLGLSVSNWLPRQVVTAAPTAVDARALSAIFREISREAIPSIVAIETKGKAVANELDLEGDDSPFGDLFRQNPQFREFFRNRPRGREMPRTQGMGSGFIIDAAGVIVTNSHVVRGAEEVKVVLSDGQEFQATDIKMDENSDVAVLRIAGAKGLKALKFGDSDGAEIGDWVLAVGNPFDVGVTVTAGIISAKSRGLGIARREDFLQTDAAINPGNSGGPLLNLSGEVIGVNTAISSRSGGSEGIGFAIPVNMVKWISQQLLTHGKVRRAYLGIGIQPLDAKLARTLKVPSIEGALILKVTDDSPAADAKLTEGDVILELNGRKVSTPQSLQLVVERLEIGKTYKALIVRDGTKREVPITVREMPEGFLTANARTGNGRGRGQAPQSKDESFNDLGVQVKDLTPEIAKELGIDDSATGVVITGVDPKGAAALAGLNVGHVIEKVGAKKISSAKDLTEALKGVSLKDGVTLLINTPSGRRFVAVQINK